MRVQTVSGGIALVPQSKADISLLNRMMTHRYGVEAAYPIKDIAFLVIGNSGHFYEYRKTPGLRVH